MSTANESPSPGAIVNTPDRDHAADSDDSLARKRQRLSEEPEARIEADEPEDFGDDLQGAIMIEDDLEADAYSCTFRVLGPKFDATVMEELKELQRLVAGECTSNPISSHRSRVVAKLNQVCKLTVVISSIL